MMRCADGSDPNIIRFPHEDNIEDCPAPRVHPSGEKCCVCKAVPDNCGRIFDDARFVVIHPHYAV